MHGQPCNFFGLCELFSVQLVLENWTRWVLLCVTYSVLVNTSITKKNRYLCVKTKNLWKSIFKDRLPNSKIIAKYDVRAPHFRGSIYMSLKSEWAKENVFFNENKNLWLPLAKKKGNLGLGASSRHQRLGRLDWPGARFFQRARSPGWPPRRLWSPPASKMKKKCFESSAWVTSSQCWAWAGPAPSPRSQAGIG